MMRLWKMNLLLVILATAALLISGHKSWASDDQDLLRLTADSSNDSLMESGDPKTRLVAISDAEDDFLARIEAYLLIASQATSDVACFGSILSPSYVLTLYEKLNSAYWSKEFNDATLTLIRVTAAFGLPEEVSQDVTDLNAVLPFPGRKAVDSTDVNTYVKNSMAVIQLPTPFTLGNGIGIIRIATDIGPNLAGTQGISGIFTTRNFVPKKLDGGVTGTQCPSTVSDAGGTLDSAAASCFTFTQSSPDSCSYIPGGSALVVSGADNNQYLVSLTGFGKSCGSGDILLVGPSMAFPDHQNFINSLLSNETSVSTSDSQPGGKIAKFWSIFQFFTALLGK